ncbi:MAG: asparagine synthase (glutamine-hydrolyzing) [Gemmatimonadaceae bacterium]|nr:asparagine synthase (glutamine-hydrolyzing) [Gemmatimonadaceae bacterium]
MCGIAGLWAPTIAPDDAARIVAGMTCAIAHRGPDADGIWTDAERGIALGHRRLSVLDLSAEGAQPMTSRDGRYVVVFNGEIYNFAAIRDRLAALGETFRGHSDTEVMLAALSRWGLDATVRELAGMFAIALWDRERATLHLVRDRLGEKPLYYGVMGGVLLFGSELKALRSHPAFRGTIDRLALTLYLRYNYVPAPRSIYEGIHKVEPGTICTIARGGAVMTTRYWDLADVVRQGAATPFAGGDEAALDEIEQVLRTCIGQQMVADVPLGAFLSGGIDSSAVVALMQAQSTRRVRTFTIGFGESGYDEATHARAVARHLGTDHTELYVTADEALRVIPRLPAIYDEPFADSSQIPTFLVAQLARGHVTVALSGDGGDEMFGGYNRYVVGARLWRHLARVPVPVRSLTARGIRTVSPARWGRVFDSIDGWLPPRLRVAQAGDRMHKLAGVLAATGEAEFYRSMASQWQQPEEVVLGGGEPTATGPGAPDSLGFVERMMFTDARTYLPDDVMTKVDRAAMAVSLETRAPFLDHRVVEAAWRLPLGMKVRDGQGKWALRQILYHHVPQQLLERPKMGFGVPLDSWLRGPLRDWASALLDGARIEREGFFRRAAVETAWREHLSGRHNRQHQLWGILIFQQWLEAQQAA